jgi:hypothetical protein
MPGSRPARCRSYSPWVGAILLLCPIARAECTQAPIPERTLGAPTVVGSERLRGIAAVRELSNGRVLVAERAPVTTMLRNMVNALTPPSLPGQPGSARAESVARRPELAPPRVLLFDAALATAKPVGHAGAEPNDYSQPERLAAGLSDTTLLLDLGRSDLLLIDPAGTIVGTRPTAATNSAILAASGAIAIDHFGRLYYQPRIQLTRNVPTGMQMITPDTAPIMSYDFKTGATVPVAEVHVAGNTVVMEADPSTPGGTRMRMSSTPFAVVDDWVMMPDGTLAIIRGADLHIDWIAPDGKRRSTPRIAYERRPVTGSDRAAYLRRGRLIDSMQVMPRGMTVVQTAPDSFPAFKPPFTMRSAMASPDGTIWLPAKIISPDKPDGFHIIGPDGRVREHIHLAKGEHLVGLGKHGIYVAITKGPRDDRLARVSLP